MDNHNLPGIKDITLKTTDLNPEMCESIGDICRTVIEHAKHERDGGKATLLEAFARPERVAIALSTNADALSLEARVTLSPSEASAIMPDNTSHSFSRVKQDKVREVIEEKLGAHLLKKLNISEHYKIKLKQKESRDPSVSLAKSPIAHAKIGLSYDICLEPDKSRQKADTQTISSESATEKQKNEVLTDLKQHIEKNLKFSVKAFDIGEERWDDWLKTIDDAINNRGAKDDVTLSIKKSGEDNIEITCEVKSDRSAATVHFSRPNASFRAVVTAPGSPWPFNERIEQLKKEGHDGAWLHMDSETVVKEDGTLKITYQIDILKKSVKQILDEQEAANLRAAGEKAIPPPQDSGSNRRRTLKDSTAPSVTGDPVDVPPPVTDTTPLAPEHVEQGVQDTDRAGTNASSSNAENQESVVHASTTERTEQQDITQTEQKRPDREAANNTTTGSSTQTRQSQQKNETKAPFSAKPSASDTAKNEQKSGKKVTTATGTSTSGKPNASNKTDKAKQPPQKADTKTSKEVPVPDRVATTSSSGQTKTEQNSNERTGVPSGAPITTPVPWATLTKRQVTRSAAKSSKTASTHGRMDDGKLRKLKRELDELKEEVRNRTDGQEDSKPAMSELEERLKNNLKQLEQDNLCKALAEKERKALEEERAKLENERDTENAPEVEKKIRELLQERSKNAGLIVAARRSQDIEDFANKQHAHGALKKNIYMFFLTAVGSLCYAISFVLERFHGTEEKCNKWRELYLTLHIMKLILEDPSLVQEPQVEGAPSEEERSQEVSQHVEREAVDGQQASVDTKLTCAATARTDGLGNNSPDGQRSAMKG